ncbi:ABC transporter permease subunit [Kistimonas asteriae]|uniref:ABC transporter permease subunit n=1 Tax=Kistimonas asteriae TaxID=517724 RepID=UPI001BAD4BE4|nr:ABC transporter permease subunit [Kistimonas asteriae]
MNALLIVAGKEFRDGLRNRWLLAIAVTLGLLAIGLAVFGAAAAGHSGFAPVATTIASLASLAVFIVPLIALLLSFDALVGEAENGTLLLLLTYPLSRDQLLLGKWLGHGGILATATVAGFGSAAVVMGVFSDAEPAELLPPFAVLMVTAILLGWCFIGIAYLISARVREKSRAAGLALVVWMLFVLVFDMGLLGLLVATGGQVDGQLFPWLLLLNPTDVFRLVNLQYLGRGEALTGIMSVAAGGVFSWLTLIVVMIGWLLLPVGLALMVFRRRPL